MTKGKLKITHLMDVLIGNTVEGVLVKNEGAYLLKVDAELLVNYGPIPLRFVYAVHRNDFLYKSNEHILKEQFKALYEHLEYDHEPRQYRLIDGEFRGAVAV